MNKLIKKLTTWLLVFGMTFTPVLTSINVIAANAEEGDTTIVVPPATKEGNAARAAEVTGDHEDDPEDEKDADGAKQLIEAAQNEVGEAEKVIVSQELSNDDLNTNALKDALATGKAKVVATVGDLNTAASAMDWATYYDNAANDALQGYEGTPQVVQVPVYVTDENGEIVYTTDENGELVPVQLVDAETNEPVYTFLLVVFTQKDEETTGYADSAIANVRIANSSDSESTARTAAGNARASLIAAESGLEDANSELSAAQGTYDNAKGKYDAAVAQRDLALAKVEEAQNALDAALKAAFDEDGEPIVKDGKKVYESGDVLAAQKALDDAVNEAKALSGIADELYNEVVKANFTLIQDQYKVVMDHVKELKDANKGWDIQYWQDTRLLCNLILQYYVLSSEDIDQDSITVGGIDFQETLLQEYKKVESTDENPQPHYADKDGDGNLDAFDNGELKLYQDYELNVDGETKIISEPASPEYHGWIFSNNNNDNRVTVRYTTKDGTEVEKYYNYDANDDGTIRIYEREYKKYANGEVVLEAKDPKASVAAKEAVGDENYPDGKPEVNDFFVGKDETGAAFSSLYNDEEGNMNQVVVNTDERKVVPDFDDEYEDLHQSATQNRSLDGKKLDGFTAVYGTESKTYELITVETDNYVIDKTGNGERTVNDGDPIYEDTSRMVLTQVRSLQSQYKPEDGYKVVVTVDTYLDWLVYLLGGDMTITYDKDYTVQNGLGKFDQWLAELAGTATYSIQVQHTESKAKVEGVLEKVFQDYSKTETTSDTKYTNKQVQDSKNMSTNSKPGNQYHYSTEEAAKNAQNSLINQKKSAWLESYGLTEANKQADGTYVKEVQNGNKTTTYTYTFVETSDKPEKKGSGNKTYYKMGKNVKVVLKETKVETTTTTTTMEGVLVEKITYAAKVFEHVFEAAVPAYEPAVEAKDPVAGNDEGRTQTLSWLTKDESEQKARENGTLVDLSTLENYQTKIQELKTQKEKLNLVLEKAKAAKAKVDKLLEEIDALRNVALGSVSVLAEKEVELAKAEEALKNAEKQKEELEQKVEEARRAVASINLDRFNETDEDVTPSGGPTGGTPSYVLPTAELPTLILPPTTAVAGARVAAAAPEEAEAAAPAAAVEAPAAEEAPVTLEEEELPAAAATTIEDEDLAGAQGVEEGAQMWWIWLLVVLAAAAGFGVYKYVDNKKKNANTVNK